MAALLVSVGLVVVAAQAGAALGGSSLAASERRPTSQPGLAPGAPEAATAGLREVPGREVPNRHIRVRPGDTLWAIAVRLAPDEDPRPLVDELMAARDGAPLEPGEVIVVPA
jgi:Tfp pilus assembly protein FimV